MTKDPIAEMEAMSTEITARVWLKDTWGWQLLIPIGLAVLAGAFHPAAQATIWWAVLAQVGGILIGLGLIPWMVFLNGRRSR
jgi:hypothetical protein